MKSAVNGTLLRMAVQLVQKSFRAHTGFCSLGPLRIMTQRYVWFNLAVTQFQVLSLRADGSVQLMQAETLFYTVTQLLEADDLNAISRDQNFRSR